MKKTNLYQVLLLTALGFVNFIDARYVEIQSMSQFNEEMKKPVILKFYAQWCPPCKAISPIYKEIAENTGDVTFLSVDVDEVPEAARKYKITNIPRIFIVSPEMSTPENVGISASAIKKAAETIKSIGKTEAKVEAQKIETPKAEIKKVEKKNEMTVTVNAEDYTALVACDNKKVVINLEPK